MTRGQLLAERREISSARTLAALMSSHVPWKPYSKNLNSNPQTRGPRKRYAWQVRRLQLAGA